MSVTSTMGDKPGVADQANTEKGRQLRRLKSNP
jgi:hypothetical protein